VPPVCILRRRQQFMVAAGIAPRAQVVAIQIAIHFFQPRLGTEARVEKGQRIVSTNNALWMTNLDHGKRHKPLSLMTMADNIKYS